jgi:Flp pilus assembly pilin Flp
MPAQSAPASLSIPLPIALCEDRMRKMIGFLKSGEGATVLGYSLLISSIAVVIVVTLQILGPNLATTFNDTAGYL